MMGKGRLFWQWVKARRLMFFYVAAVFGCFFLVNGVYGHSFGVAGYAALLAFVLGLVPAGMDFVRFAARHTALARLPGRFPTSFLPQPAGLVEQDYTAIILALEAERARLQQENERVAKDASEYYTLWAHQIKTPMAAMRLLLQSSRAPALQPQERSDLEQELFRIGQYVEMVLQYQRLASMENDLVLERIPLDVLVKKAAKGCAPLFIYRGFALDTNGVAGEVVTDEKWFCFVLEQLLTNAVKYTEKGTIRVYSQGEALLVVEDTGIGISPQDLPRVFERGFTGTVGRSERSSTGIGLYLCRQIMARLGFDISITSEPGRGTKVLLHLGQVALDLE